MRILLVEDDLETSTYVSGGLRQAGHAVHTSARGSDGLFHASETPFDVLIVDRMLPEMDGLALVRAVRARGIATPVLFLTALGNVSDRVAGLEAGADDYLVKPFAFAELQARVNALARRAPLRDGNEEPTLLSTGDLTFDRLRRSVRRGDTPIELQPREQRLLEELLLNAGRILTRTMLLERVWEFHFDPGTNIVESHMSRLRAKIDRGGDPPLIHTIRGAGYMIDAS